MTSSVGSGAALVQSGDTLKHRVLRAGLWTSLLLGITRGAGFIRNVVLARLLAPDDLGVYGIALVALSVTEHFSNSGLQSALVQTDRDVRDLLDSAWTIQVVRGALLCTGLALTSSPLAALLGDSRAAPLIVMVGLAGLLRSLQNPGMLLYRRELELRSQVVQRVSGTLVELVVSVSLAVLLRRAWVLALGMVAGKAALLVASYTLHSFRPRVRLAWHQLRELSRYGRWVFVDNVLFFLAYRGDNLIVGKFFGAPSLGVYLLAYSISEVVTVEISRIAREMAFPAYARIQNDAARVRRAFVVMLDCVSSVTLPVAVALALLAEPLTHALFGARWSSMATLLPPLALAGSLRAIIATATSTFAALGAPALRFKTNMVTVVCTYIAMVPLTSAWGLRGVAMAVAVGHVIALVPLGFYAERLLGVSVRDLARHLIPALALVAIVSLTLVSARTILTNNSLGSVALTLLIGVLAYGGAAAFLWVRATRGPVGVLILFRSSRRAAAV